MHLKRRYLSALMFTLAVMVERLSPIGDILHGNNSQANLLVALAADKQRYLLIRSHIDWHALEFVANWRHFALPERRVSPLQPRLVPSPGLRPRLLSAFRVKDQTAGEEGFLLCDYVIPL